MQQDWDSFRNARLADAVSVTAGDGADCGPTSTTREEAPPSLSPPLRRKPERRLPGRSPFFAEQGCNLLLPDARNHGESGGTFSGFGALEADDLLCWLDWIDRELDGQTVILYGAGMGAVTALLAAEQGLPTTWPSWWRKAPTPLWTTSPAIC